MTNYLRLIYGICNMYNICIDWKEAKPLVYKQLSNLMLAFAYMPNDDETKCQMIKCT